MLHLRCFNIIRNHHCEHLCNVWYDDTEVVSRAFISVFGIIYIPGTVRRACGVFVFLGAWVTFLASPSDGGNILLFPVDGSHWINMKVLVEELHAKGHSLTVIRSNTSWYIPEKSPLYTSVTIEMNEAFEDFFNMFLNEHMRVRDVRICAEPHMVLQLFT